jgi:hypothetical protein
MLVTLIQPRAPWGFHPYLPNGLLSVAARLATQGIRSMIFDENIGDRPSDLAMRHALGQSDALGIGVLGSPYIPEAIRVGRELRRLGYTQPIFIGGEVAMRLTATQFDRIFSRIGGNVVRVESDDALGRAFGVTLPSMFDVSMASAIRGLSNHAREAYFRKEWCLFTSQGCIYKCNFCAATKGVKERFRGPDALRDEITCITEEILAHAGSRPAYEVYLSTLDGLQNPDEMYDTLSIVRATALRRGLQLKLRFLATAKCTVRAERNDEGILRQFRALGVECIGIGVDGDDPVVWARENKRHNDASEIAQAFRLIKDASIQPEAFMVIGFPGDDFKSLYRGSRACFRFAQDGIRPRPYLGKAHAPGSKVWEEDTETVERFLANPDLFRELDYGGLASPATHADRQQRIAANAAFFATTMALKVVSRYGCPTQPLLPTESVSWPQRVIGRVWNRLMPQDR